MAGIYVSKTQHYLKVKKPLLERERRARINKCLDALKLLIADFQADDAILRMDKAEMLEATIVFMRHHGNPKLSRLNNKPQRSMDSFRHGYINAVNEVSRVMAGTPGMSVELGKSVMMHLGREFNRMLQREAQIRIFAEQDSTQPMSPASSGYHSDGDESCFSSPASTQQTVWRPWLM